MLDVERKCSDFNLVLVTICLISESFESDKFNLKKTSTCYIQNYKKSIKSIVNSCVPSDTNQKICKSKTCLVIVSVPTKWFRK